MRKWFFMLPVLLSCLLLGTLLCLAYFANTDGPHHRHSATYSQLYSFETALTNFYLDCGRFPATEEGLAILAFLPATHPLSEKWKGPYLTGKVPTDPWGNAYIYHSPAIPPEEAPYEIISLASDGKAGGQGDNEDIISWKLHPD